jgi:GCN5-like protein 1 (GCN5L1)
MEASKASIMNPSQSSEAGSSSAPQTSDTLRPSSSSSPPSTATLNTQTDTERFAEAKDAVTASLVSVGTNINADLQVRAADMHANAAAIAKQEQQLQAQTAALAKQTARWKKELDASTRKLNELGDVQNWTETLERDLLVLEEVVRLKEGREDAGLISGTNAPLGGSGTGRS